MKRSHTIAAESRPAGDRQTQPTDAWPRNWTRTACLRKTSVHTEGMAWGARDSRGQCWGRAMPCHAEGTEALPPVAGSHRCVSGSHEEQGDVL